MYKLSSLPIEILYLVGSHLDIQDLMILGRLNHWYGYWISVILGERIETCVKQEGWRIHIDILAKSYPTNNNPSFPFSTELLLLGEYCKINPYTLTLEFNLCPIDQDGLNAMTSSSKSERSIILFDTIKTNIDMVAYFAQISTNRRLQHVNQAGAALINDRDLWKQLLLQHNDSSLIGKMAVMGSAFKVQYEMSSIKNDEIDMMKLIDKFQTDYDQHSQQQQQQQEELLLKEKDTPAFISFDKIQVSPEWWIHQMKLGTYSSNGPSNIIFSEHGYW